MSTQGTVSCCYWLTGLSGAGKTTLAKAIEQVLLARDIPVIVLDGDALRTGLNSDLGFSRADRAENVRRIGEVARLLTTSGFVVLVAAIAPYREDRQKVRQRFHTGRFFEVFVDAELQTCMERDVKGLYQRALNQEIQEFTGISAPYEAPEQADVHIHTSLLSIDESVAAVIDHYQAHVLLSHYFNESNRSANA